MSTEGVQLVRRQWWSGSALGVVGVLALSLGVDAQAASSYAMGLLAVLLGNLAAGWFTFRRRAPSGSEAAVALVVGMVLRWLVVVAVLLAAFLVPAVRPLWVLAGIAVALGGALLAALTFKR